MRVAVTGASGFLGSHLLMALRDAGHVPVAFIRASSDRTFIDEGGYRHRVVDLAAEPEELAVALSDVDALIHAAGGGKVTTVAEMDALNVEPTRRLWAAAERAGLEKAILVSSLAAVGPSARGTPHDDDAPPRPQSRYGQSKRRAEEIVLAARDRVPSVIVRPPALFGPRDDRIVPVLQMAERGVVFDVGPRRMAICTGRDTAEAIVALLERPTTSGDAFFVEQGESTSIRELAGHFARAMRKRPPVAVPVPGFVLTGAALSVEAFTCLTRGKSPFNRDKLKDAAPYMECSGARLREVTGVAPPSLAASVEETVAWYLGRAAA